MEDKVYELGDGYRYLTANCTPNTCNFQIRAEPVEATSMCGALVGTSIETYFQLAKESGHDIKTAMRPLLKAINLGFESAGYTVDIEVHKKSED